MEAAGSHAIHVPKDIHDWEAQRQEARLTLGKLLGDLPPLFTPQPTITAVEQHDGFTLERFEFDNGANAVVYGLLLIPAANRPMPAILYNHAHGGNYARGKDELFQDDPIGTGRGSALAQAGYVVIAVDAYAFGQRQSQAPNPHISTGSETEQAWFKKFLWEGKSLWGMMLRDDLLALNYLLTRPEVDAARVGTTGMSLGGSRATWLAALDERIAAVIPVAQMTRYRDFAERGDFNLHSIYYYVPGVFQSGLDMEVIVSLSAPRPQTILIGDSDPLSPIEGVDKIAAFARQVYGLYHASDQLQVIVYGGIGHTYTPAMFRAMLDGFRAGLCL
jgi:dienelactone hydrolase